MGCFCSIFKGSVIFDVSHCSLECAPCCVGQVFTEVKHGTGHVSDFEMAIEGGIIGGSAAEDAQRVSGTATARICASCAHRDGAKECVSAGRGRYAACGTTPDSGFKDTCFFEWRSLTAWHSKAFPEMMALASEKCERAFGGICDCASFACEKEGFLG